MPTNNLKFIFDPGRTGEDHWEINQAEDIEYWCRSIDLIKQRDYIHDDCNIKVTANWAPVVRKLKKKNEWLKRAYSGAFSNIVEIPLIKGSVDIRTQIKVSGKNSLSGHSWYSNFFQEHFLYEVFLVMNLSRPGVCDFYNLHMFEVPFNSKRSMEKKRLSLSSYNFEFAWEESLRGNFPKLRELQLDEVMQWYSVLNIGVRQKAVKPIEKAIFSLLHICKTDGDISSVVWVFHALEALFSTRVGEGFTNLINRISIVLELDHKQKSIVKKNLRKLYDMRSSLIHGVTDKTKPQPAELQNRGPRGDYTHRRISVDAALKNTSNKGKSANDGT